MHDLAALGWHVVMGCRNPDRAAAAVAAVRAATPAAKLDTLRVDVASMASVQAAASEFTSRCVNHACVYVLCDRISCAVRAAPDAS